MGVLFSPPSCSRTKAERGCLCNHGCALSRRALSKCPYGAGTFRCPTSVRASFQPREEQRSFSKCRFGDRGRPVSPTAPPGWQVGAAEEPVAHRAAQGGIWHFKIAPKGMSPWAAVVPLGAEPGMWCSDPLRTCWKEPGGKQSVRLVHWASLWFPGCWGGGGSGLSYPRG